MMKFPRVSREQMAEVDNRVPGEYGITVSRMMENAGYHIADFVRKEIDPDGLTVYAGKGNNGGDALVAARRLHLWNYQVEVVLATEDLDGIRREELEILEEIGVEISLESSSRDHSLALEGLIGYNLKGDPRPPFDSMVEEINDHEIVVSIDIPTGLDADTGEEAFPSIDPDYTVTLSLPFQGMNEGNSGEIWIADISVPPEAYEEFGFRGDIFGEESLVLLEE